MLRTNRIIPRLCCLHFLWAQMALAQNAELAPFPVESFQLENGLRVILSEDFSLPLVSVVVAYNVGSVHEKANKKGLAYLLENLMFQGSKNIGPMQHINFIQKIGGSLNAVTTEDKTIFYQTVPSNQLALVLWLEADRMTSIVFDTQKVERIKRSLIEEIQNRKAEDPYFDSALNFDRMLYPSEAYSQSVLGKEEDLMDMSGDDVRAFYTTYYAPNNAVLSIAGDFSRSKAISLIQKYFETIPRGDPVPLFTAESHRPPEETVRTLENFTTPTPAFYLGYRIVSPNSSDFYALTIIEYIFLRGRSSRLYNRLLQKDRTARQISGGIEQRKNLAAFKIFCRANTNAMMERSQKTLFSEIGRLKSDLVLEEELQKAKNMFKVEYVNQYARLVDRAIFLAERYLSKDAMEDILLELNKYMAVTPASVIGIANRYLTKDIILLNIKTK